MAKPMLTQKQIDDYVADWGRHCPYCGSENILSSEFSASLDSAGSGLVSQRMDCQACHKAWEDQYRLNWVEAI